MQDTLQDIPFNLYKQAEPLVAKILENTHLTVDSPNDVRHIVIDFSGSNYRFLAGQSAGILPPGLDALGKPNKLRLYSIASSAAGEHYGPQTLALCVKRVVYTIPETGEERKGVCSNFLCDLKPGDSVSMTGPAGKSFLLPQIPDANLIMIATGTGIAPFRGFLHQRYKEPPQKTGESWLFFGIQHRADFLYEEELCDYKSEDSYHLVTAISREEKTADGRKMYVQDRIAENAHALIELMEKPNTYLYMCGLRGMETGIIDALDKACQTTGKNWQALLQQMTTENRWHVEVY